MFALMRATLAAVPAARGRYVKFKIGMSVAAMLSTAGCSHAPGHFAAHDPADPAAKVAPVRYRAVTSPYVSLRPSAPGLWRERNDDVAPRPDANR